MEEKHADLSWEEKREERFNKWLEAPGVEFVSPEAKKAYQERVTRFIKVIKLEEPDRVPFFLPAGNFPAYYAGTTLMKTMYDYEELLRAWKKFRQDFDSDVAMGSGLVWPGKVFERIDYKLLKWPGHGLAPESRSYQYIEGEYMKADEYDHLIEDPSDFWLRIIMPRIAGALEPLKYLNSFNPMSGIPMGFIAPFARKDVQSAFQALMEAGEELMKWMTATAEANREELVEGYPPFGGGFSGAPFDMIGDMLRGTHGIMLDMYQQPDKLLEALEKITPMTVDLAVAGADATLSPIVPMPLHKGADSFMSDKQFETFYWPTLRKVLIGIIEEGLVPMPLAEAFYDKRLGYIKDVPRSSVIWWFERTDMAKAKKVLGNTTCIAGNVPTSLLSTGTPQEVKEYCRKLIETCGKGGGYILTGASSVEETTADNLRAMMEAAKEYGVYKQ
jgi:uroporphyrinogen-III decarboxylase